MDTLDVDGENPSLLHAPPYTVISHFQPSFPYNVCRTCRSGDEAWLSGLMEEQIYSVDQKGIIKEKIELKLKICSMAVSPSTGHLWFTVTTDRSIREITSDGSIVKRFDVEFFPWSLCIPPQGLVAVGLANYGIALYTAEGHQVIDEEGHVYRQEAVLPWYMACCTITGDVAVSYTDNVSFDNYMIGKGVGKQPRIIVMDKQLKLKYQCRYIEGIGSQIGGSQQSKFYPYDVCFDGLGDVLVAERVTRSVVMVGGNTGHYLRTIYVSSEGEPGRISLQNDNTLWIGHLNREIKIIEYTK